MATHWKWIELKFQDKHRYFGKNKSGVSLITICPSSCHQTAIGKCLKLSQREKKG